MNLHSNPPHVDVFWGELAPCDHRLALFCAYPRIGATRDLGDSLAEVCALHTKVALA